MAMKEQPKTVYRSMQGKEVDMHKLSMQNEMTMAIGNVRVNARGDELGPGGKIIRKREDILREAQGAAPEQTYVQKPVNPVAAAIAPVQTVADMSKRSNKKEVLDMDPEGNE